MPSTAALVKQAIGADRAAAMDVAAACSGFVYGYSLAHAQIVAGLARHVLVIGAEVLSRFLDYTDRNTCVLFGDGAGAVVLSAASEPGGARGIELTTDPTGAYKIWLPAGGAAAPASDETVAGRGHYLRMEGRETYKYATRTIATTALAAIDHAGWAPEFIDLLIPHQANLRIIESVSKGLGFPMERIFINLDRYGNTSAASVPIALAEAVDSGRVHPGDRLVFVAFGAGFTSGAVAMEWTADPAAAARAASIGPDAVPVTIPDDWESVGPVPEVLVRAFAAKGIDVARAGRPPRPPPSPRHCGTPAAPDASPATTEPAAPGAPGTPRSPSRPARTDPPRRRRGDRAPSPPTTRPRTPRRPSHDRPVRQERDRHGRLARDRPCHRPRARPPGRGRRLQLQGERRGGRARSRPPSRRWAARRSPIAATSRTPTRPRGSSPRRSARTAGSTSS